jgi:3-dehydroquinate synthase
MSDQLEIRSYRYRYTAAFISDTPARLAATVRPGDGVVVDANVLRLYDFITPAIAATNNVIVVEPTESAKSYDQVSAVIQRLIDRRFTKRGQLIAIGGGIVQDITAFTASIFSRGVNWIFFPTNLLSQCDSCIGSKTSINFGPYKNQLGGFYPPRAVFIDLAFLQTLPPREISSGLGEMMHYFLVDGDEAFAWAESRIGHGPIPADTMRQMIERSLSIKKAMIERDEFDEGPRAVFNYGHSFGHALESATDYAVPHGIAVSYGMDLANLVSVQLGLIPMAVRNRARATLSHIWSDTPLDPIDQQRYRAALGRDKKNEGPEVKVILTRGIGNMFKTTLPLGDPAIDSLLERFFTEKLYARSL